MTPEESADMAERRGEERIELVGDVSFVFPDSSGDNDGVVLNVSISGAAIFTHHELKEGTIIKVKGDGVWESERSARVMWCRKVNDNIFQCGLSLS